MTRAALLHVLDHPTAIAPAEVRELEQLAQAFPYCQTAHLLLAKAAHDQGTMLAGQRLRRAATYAADRELLRRLIEQVAPVEAPAAEQDALPSDTALAPLSVVVEPMATAPAAASAEAAPDAAEATAAATPLGSTDNSAAIPELAALVSEDEAPEIAATVEAVGAPEPDALPNEAALLAGEGAPLPTAEETPFSAAIAEAALAEVVPAEAATTSPAVLSLETFPVPTPEAPAADEPELPAVAPPIRAPEAAGAARAEFDLLEAPTDAAPVYELPGLVDEWAAAASTLALAPPATASLPEMASARGLTAADFTGDAELGYGLGSSSRLGFAVQLLNSWEADDRAAAAGPTASLPPTGEFFAPDALLLNHWAAHRPPEAPTPVDLINTFLRRQPRLTRPAMLPPASGAQADLSARSTRPETELASEGLAQILARQGKTARAIEIYERLMVKQPEKMAYFAAQIHQLQPPAR